MEKNFEKKNGLAGFIDEIKELQRQEMAGELPTGYFFARGKAELNPEELTEADMDIWAKVKDGSVTIEDFQAYKDTVFAEGMAAEIDPEKTSRGAFVRFIGNKANAVINADLMRKVGERQ